MLRHTKIEEYVKEINEHGLADYLDMVSDAMARIAGRISTNDSDGRLAQIAWCVLADRVEEIARRARSTVVKYDQR